MAQVLDLGLVPVFEEQLARGYHKAYVLGYEVMNTGIC